MGSGAWPRQHQGTRWWGTRDRMHVAWVRGALFFVCHEELGEAPATDSLGSSGCSSSRDSKETAPVFKGQHRQFLEPLWPESKASVPSWPLDPCFQIQKLNLRTVVAPSP